MKIAIVSDIHGNMDAWRGFVEDYDELLVLGDLVNYGPQPELVVREVMERATLVVQGNHDYAVAYGDDSLWRRRYRMMAETTRKFTSGSLQTAELDYLRRLPQQLETERVGVRFHLVHAMPSNPLWGSLAPNSSMWIQELDMSRLMYCSLATVIFLLSAR